MPATAQRQISAYYKTQQGYRETSTSAATCWLLPFEVRADGLVKLKDVLALDVDLGLAELQQLGQEARGSMRAATGPTALLASMVTYRCMLQYR